MVEIKLPAFEDLIEIIKHEQKIDSIYKSHRQITIDLSFENEKYYITFKTILKENSICVLLDTLKPVLSKLWITNFDLNKYANPIDIAIFIYQNAYLFAEHPSTLNYYFDEQKLFKVYIKCLETEEYNKNPSFLFSSINHVLYETNNIWAKKILNEAINTAKNLDFKDLFKKLYKLKEDMLKQIYLNTLQSLKKDNHE